MATVEVSCKNIEGLLGKVSEDSKPSEMDSLSLLERNKK